MVKLKGAIVVLIFVCLSVIIVQGVGASGECDCKLVPNRITISRGTMLKFDVTIRNNTNQDGEVMFGGKITTPDGNLTGWVYGPTDPFLIATSGEISDRITFNVPSNAAVGRYTYHGYVGRPGNIFAECQFDFIVPADVPETGQSNCYDAYGHMIDCTGTNQDGDKQPGLASPELRFQDNGDGTVTDNLTGLVWLKAPNCGGLERELEWEEALYYCENLNSGECGLADGSEAGDWRLPSVKEFQGLISFGNFYPAIESGHPFVGVLTSYSDYWEYNWYWSSTTHAYFTRKAWCVGMDFGTVDARDKLYGCGVWPVRGPE